MKNAKLLTLSLILSASALTANAEAAINWSRPCGLSVKEMVAKAPANPGQKNREGLNQGMSGQAMANVQDWALQTLQNLKDMLAQSEGMPVLEQRKYLYSCMENAEHDSKPLGTEIILRYALNRAMAAVETIDREAIQFGYEKQGDGYRFYSFAPGSVDQQVRILRMGIDLALKFYKSDIATENGSIVKLKLREMTDHDYASFGIEFHDRFKQVTWSIYDATAQYAVMKGAMGWLISDLSSGATTVVYGRTAATLQSAWQQLPDPRGLTDYSAVIGVRQMRDILRNAENQIASVQDELKKAGYR